MYVLLALSALVLFLGFVVWDRRRLQSGKVQPMPRRALSRGWRPTPLLVWPVYAGLALCAAVLGTVELYEPSQPPFTGRWPSLYASAHATLGRFGVAYYWFGASALLCLAALAKWSSRAPTNTNSEPPNAL